MTAARAGGAARAAGAGPDSAAPELRIRGNATAEELAVVLALVAQAESAPPAAPATYDRWRTTRLAALRAGLRLGRRVTRRG